MPISSRLLNRASNSCVITPAWATVNDWLESLASKPAATPLVDFGLGSKYRVGVTALNWYLMDLLGLRTKWLTFGWQSRDEVWLLINPLRYRLLGHQPQRPYPLDVRDFLRDCAPEVLHHPIAQHALFALAPTIEKHTIDDNEAERLAAQAPWARLAVLEDDLIVGMVWAATNRMGTLPPVMAFPSHRF